MWVVFRSGRLLIGILTTYSSAVLLTLLVEPLFGRKIGIRTANLSTIVFVAALDKVRSHHSNFTGLLTETFTRGS